MARSQVGASWSYGNTGSATTAPFSARTITAGALVVVFFRHEASNATVTVSDNRGGTWQVQKHFNSNVSSGIAWSWNHPGGSTTITINYSAAQSYRYATAAEFTGGDTADPYQSGSLTTSNATLNHSVPFTPNALIASVQGNYNGSTYGITTGTLVGNSSYHQGSVILAGTSSPANPRYTGGTGNTASLSIAFSDPAPVVFTSQPSDASVVEGETANFAATVTGATSYQWEVNTSGGSGDPPTLIGQQMLVGGVNNVTVPSDAVAALVCYSWWNDGGGVPTLASTLATFATNLVSQAANGSSPYQSGVARSHAAVTATGSRTVTIGSLSGDVEGPAGVIFYLKDVDPSTMVVSVDWSRPGDGGTATISLTTGGQTTVFAWDAETGTASVVPSNPSGWTSLDTVQSNRHSGRARSLSSPSNPQTVTSTRTVYPIIVGFAVRGVSPWANVSGGSGGTTDSYTTAATTLAMDGYLFRLKATGPGGTVYSDVVSLTVSAGGSATDLVIQSAAHAHTAESLALTADSTLAIDSAAHAHSAGALTLSIGTSLTTADATHAHTAQALTLTTDSTLAIANASHAHTAGAVVLTTDSTLEVASATHGHTAENLTLDTALSVDLVIASATHAHAAQSLTLATASTTLAVEGATHGHTAGSLTLTLDTTLATNSASHAHSADNVGLSTTGAVDLDISSASHAHSADSVFLSANSFIIVSDAGHGHYSDVVNLSAEAFISVDAANHAHVSENITLGTEGSTTISINDSYHQHSSDNTTLITDSTIAVLNASHGHIAESLTLWVDLAISIDDATHSHNADNIDLSSAPALDISSAVHGHDADVVSLSSASWILIGNAIHSHMADNVNLSSGDIEIEEAFIVDGRPRTWMVIGSPRTWRVSNDH